ncbi:MAG: S49 family peptidase [Bacilli bacterium]
MAKYKRGSLTLARQVFNTPQLILADDLQNIAQYLVNRANGIEFEVEQKEEQLGTSVVDKNLVLTEEEQRDRRFRQLGITNNGKRGNLNITGTLVAKAGEIDADCMELTSYEKLHSTFQKQVNEGIQELVLHVNSGGGSAFSCFEMAKEVKDLATSKGIKIYAWVDGLSASAAYAWTSIADEIVARKDSEVGSVGVVVQLINNSKMLENIGITRQFVYHGDQKIPFTDSGEFSPQFISSIQKKVDKTGLEFNTFVASNRNMSVEDVIATNAEVFDADQALAVGFIDKIMTQSEFFNDYLPSKGLNQHSMYYLEHNKETQTMSEQNVQEQVASVEELTAQLATAKTDKQSLEAQVAKLQGDLSKVQSDLSASVLAKEHAESELTKFKADAAHNARVEQLASVFGADSEKPQMYATMFASLDAEAFGKVVSDFQASVKTQEQSMEEVGHSASASAIAETPEEMLLKQAQARKAKQKA